MAIIDAYTILDFLSNLLSGKVTFILLPLSFVLYLL